MGLLRWFQERRERREKEREERVWREIGAPALERMKHPQMHSLARQTREWQERRRIYRQFGEPALARGNRKLAEILKQNSLTNIEKTEQ